VVRFQLQSVAEKKHNFLARIFHPAAATTNCELFEAVVAAAG